MAIPYLLDPNSRPGNRLLNAATPDAYIGGIMESIAPTPQMPVANTGVRPPMAPPGLVQVPEEKPGILGRIGSFISNPAVNQRLMALGSELLANSGYQTTPVTTGAGLGRGLQAMNQAGMQYDQMIAQQAADRLNKQMLARKEQREEEELSLKKSKESREAGASSDPFSVFGDSAEGRQLAVLAKQFAEVNGVPAKDAIFAVSRWNQEQAPSAVAIPAGGELREVKRPSLFDGAGQQQPGAIPPSGGLTVGPPIASRPPAPEKPKELPQYLVNIVQDNQSKLRMLDQIADLVDNPDAASVLGKKNLIPGIDSFAKYFRSGDQNQLAGMISGLQSMTYKDISGANVTASEEPRLKRYVPDVTDDPETVKRKIELFRNEYRTIQQEVEQIARDQGYKPVTVIQPDAPAGGKKADLSKFDRRK